MEQPEPPGWQRYQENVAAFFRSLGFTAKVDQIVEGVRSKHAIDVLVSFEKWGILQIWIIECKKHARPIIKADVETLKSIVLEVGASLGFLLTESGFQSGAFDAARKTNVILSSLEELQTKSREDVMREALSAVEFRAVELLDKMRREFVSDVDSSPGHSSLRMRDGVEIERYFSMVGSIALARMALDKVRLGIFPVMLPGDFDKSSNAYMLCTNLEEFIAGAQDLLNRAEAWVALQNPQ